MRSPWLPTFLFGLLTIWTGLWRGIEAQAYKPNALWFCLVMGLTSIAGSFLLRAGRRRAGTITALVPAAIVLAVYFREFTLAPEENATFRVGIVLLASIAQIALLLLPSPPRSTSQP